MLFSDEWNVLNVAITDRNPENRITVTSEMISTAGSGIYKEKIPKFFNIVSLSRKVTALPAMNAVKAKTEKSVKVSQSIIL